MAEPLDRTIKPLYLKDSDVQCCDDNRVTDFMLMERVIEVIGNSLHCLQLDRNLWRIYVKTQDSRRKLLTEGISVQNISVSIFDTNPYSSGNHDPTVNTLKIRLCGLPLSIDESAVIELLDKLGVKLKSKILYENIRHPVTNKMTSILNGNRFVYVEPLENGKVLPRVNYCAGVRCLLFHYGQPKLQRNLTCTQCWESGHTAKNCKNASRCRVCKNSGHKPGDSKCTSYEVQENVVSFNGENNILSNFHPCDLQAFGVQHKSAEHAFQYCKALRCGDLDAAKLIQEASDALSAKRIGDKVKVNVQWNESSEDVMKEIIENKCNQVERFREKLRSVKKDTVFAESTFNDKWGTGLDKTGTQNTKPSDWPGQNVLGQIIGKVAKKIRKRKKSDQWSQPTQSSRQQKKHGTAQKNIAEMFRTLRTQMDFESTSGCDASSDSDTDPGESANG